VFQQKAVKRKANFEKSKELKEQLRVIRKENAASNSP
jgi:COX assembly protein 2